MCFIADLKKVIKMYEDHPPKKGANVTMCIGASAVFEKALEMKISWEEYDQVCAHFMMCVDYFVCVYISLFLRLLPFNRLLSNMPSTYMLIRYPYFIYCMVAGNACMLPEMQMKELVRLEKALDETMEPWLKDGMTTMAVSILGNYPPQRQAKRMPQCAHMDYPLELLRLGVRAYVIIEALAVYNLWVWILSHQDMKAYASTLGWDAANGVFRDTNGMGLDKGFATFMKTQRHPTLIILQPGQRLVMHGFLIHAGAAGWLQNDPAFRVHWYMMATDHVEKADQRPSTYPLHMLDRNGNVSSKHIAAMFAEARGL
jgi:hypothetical protein